MCLNGSLAGLVAITAGCDAVNVFGSFVIGILSGCMVCFIVWLLDYKLKVDDPVGAVAVHFGNGLLGTICVGLFACGTDTMIIIWRWIPFIRRSIIRLIGNWCMDCYNYVYYFLHY